MKLQGQPDLTVTLIQRRFGRTRPVTLFKFDDKGYAEIDEKRFSPTDLSKLMAKFKVVDEENKKSIDKADDSENDIRQLAKEKGIKSWHVKSIEKLKQELEVLNE